MVFLIPFLITMESAGFDGAPLLFAFTLITSVLVAVPVSLWLSLHYNTVVTFTPSAPLDPGTAYSASLSYCRGDASIDFTTSWASVNIECRRRHSRRRWCGEGWPVWWARAGTRTSSTATLSR